MRQAVTPHQLRLFEAVAERVLSHRRKVSQVVAQLADNVKAAAFRGVTPFLTHCNLAGRRGVQHRNTSREVLRELQQQGLVTYKAYKPNLGIRYWINWAWVFELRDRLGVNVYQPWQGQPVRTKAQYERAYAEHLAERERKRAERERRQAEEATQRPEGGEALQQQAEVLEALLAGDFATRDPRKRAQLERRLDELRRAAPGGSAEG